MTALEGWGDRRKGVVYFPVVLCRGGQKNCSTEYFTPFRLEHLEIRQRRAQIQYNTGVVSAKFVRSDCAPVPSLRQIRLWSKRSLVRVCSLPHGRER